MQLIKRTKCAVTGAEDIEKLCTIRHFPIYCGVTDELPETDLYADMDWGISRSSGLVQLMNLISEDVLYKTGHDSGITGKIWIEHHQAFADFIYKYHSEINDVFEICGGHGILAKNYKGKASWTILEPNPNPVDGTPAKYIKGFFSADYEYGGHFDAFVHSHTFEHIYDYRDFMQHISNFIPVGKYLVFSLPNIEEWFSKKFSNAINFEHTVLLTEPYIDYLLLNYGFKVLEKKYFQDHSIFYAAVRDVSVNYSYVLPENLYEKNKKLFMDFYQHYELEVDKLNKSLDVNTGGGGDIFGAHIFTQILVTMGLKTDKLLFCLDNDINKQGKRLVGTNLLVRSPKILKDIKNPVLILKAGAYTQEIKSDILKNINSDCVFLE